MPLQCPPFGIFGEFIPSFSQYFSVAACSLSGWGCVPTSCIIKKHWLCLFSDRNGGFLGHMIRGYPFSSSGRIFLFVANPSRRLGIPFCTPLAWDSRDSDWKNQNLHPRLGKSIMVHRNMPFAHMTGFIPV